MNEILYAFLGSIVSIIVTWIFNLISSKRQHKMDMQKLAVQNKLEVSKTAISWLTEAKSDLYVCIWYLEHYTELESTLINNIIERSQKLVALEAEAKVHFNPIVLYYKLDDIEEKYNVRLIMPQILTLQNSLAVLQQNPHASIEEYDKLLRELLSLLKQLHDAITEIIEKIRQDNLNYLQN